MAIVLYGAKSGRPPCELKPTLPYGIQCGRRFHGQRWSRLVRQLGGLAKVDRVSFLRRQFLRHFRHSIDLVGRLAAEGRVRASPVVIVDPGTDAGLRFPSRMR